MTEAKYTSPNQFANMLEARSKELATIADRLQNELGAGMAARAVRHCANRIALEATGIRTEFRERKAPA
jgi:hypothetical protein